MAAAITLEFEMDVDVCLDLTVGAATDSSVIATDAAGRRRCAIPRKIGNRISVCDAPLDGDEALCGDCRRGHRTFTTRGLVARGTAIATTMANRTMASYLRNGTAVDVSIYYVETEDVYRLPRAFPHLKDGKDIVDAVRERWIGSVGRSSDGELLAAVDFRFAASTSHPAVWLR